MTTGEKIKFFRILSSLTQKNIASFAALTQKMIVDYEQGKTTPNIHFLSLFCDLLDLNLNFFLKNELPIFTKSLWAIKFEVTKEAKKEYFLFDSFFTEYVKMIELFRLSVYDYYVCLIQDQKIIVQSKTFNMLFEFLSNAVKEKIVKVTKTTAINLENFEKSIIDTETLQKRAIVKEILRTMQKHRISIEDLQSVTL